jgi:hypothetical protein
VQEKKESRKFSAPLRRPATNISGAAAGKAVLISDPLRQGGNGNIQGARKERSANFRSPSIASSNISGAAGKAVRESISAPLLSIESSSSSSSNISGAGGKAVIPNLRSTSTGSGNDISGKAVLVSSAAPLRQGAVATSLNKVFEEEKGDVVVELGGMRIFELSPLLSTLFCSRVSLLS